jgi:hypothetical protein
MDAVNRFKYALAFRQHLKERGWEGRAVELSEAPLPDKLEGRSASFGSWQECVDAKAQRSSKWWLLPAEGDAGGATLGLGAEPAGVRALGWLAYGAGAQGVRYTRAFEGFRVASWESAASPAALFYPSVTLGAGAPLAIQSVRLALLRDGLEDYELLKLAEARAGAAFAQSWALRLAESPSEYAKDPGRYDAAKRALAAAAQKPTAQ